MAGRGKNCSGWNHSVWLLFLLLLLAALPDFSSCVVLGSPSFLRQKTKSMKETFIEGTALELEVIFKSALPGVKRSRKLELIAQ